jgi:hypothetical protein
VPFTITKFLIYDSSVAAIVSAMPSLQETPLSSALLSLLGGTTAGVAAAAASTPADVLLTRTQAAQVRRDRGLHTVVYLGELHR